MVSLAQLVITFEFLSLFSKEWVWSDHVGLPVTKVLYTMLLVPEANSLSASSRGHRNPPRIGTQLKPGHGFTWGALF